MDNKQYLWAIGGRIPESDDDTVVIISAATEDEAHEKFKSALEGFSGRDEAEIEHCIDKFGDAFYITSTQVIGEILPNGLILPSSIALPQKPVVVITVEGGLIQSVSSSETTRVIVLDSDIEGGGDNIHEIDGEDVCVSDYHLNIDTSNPLAKLNAEYILDIVAEVDAIETETETAA
jgi:hypothetical protein